MKTRVNQLFVQILLLIVITGIIAYACMYLMAIADKFVGTTEEVLTKLNFGF